MTAFNRVFQDGVLAVALVDKAYAAFLTQHCKPGFFEDAGSQWLFDTIQRVFVATRSVADYSILDNELSKLSPSDRMVYGAVVGRIMGDCPHVNKEYIKNETTEWLQRSVFVEGHRASMELYNEGKLHEAIETSRTTSNRAAVLGSSLVRPPSWMFRDVLAEYRERGEELLEGGGILARTGLARLDNALNGGVRLQEFAAFLGDLKAGKSTFLDNLSVINARIGNCTLLVSLEGRRRQRVDRLEAWLSRTAYNKVRGNIIPTQIRDLRAEEAMVYSGFSELIFQSLTTEYKYTILDVEELLKQVRAEGLNPTVVIIDYCSLLYPADGLRYNSRYEAEGRVFREASRFCQRNNVALFTADQARRATTKKPHIKTRTDTGDSYEKPRILDWQFSINPLVPDEEEDDGAAPPRTNYDADVYLSVGRDSASGARFRVNVNWETMSITEQEQGEAN